MQGKKCKKLPARNGKKRMEWGKKNTKKRKQIEKYKNHSTEIP